MSSRMAMVTTTMREVVVRMGVMLHTYCSLQAQVSGVCVPACVCVPASNFAPTVVPQAVRME